MYGERPTASPNAPDMKDAAKAAPTSRLATQSRWRSYRRCVRPTAWARRYRIPSIGSLLRLVSWRRRYFALIARARHRDFVAVTSWLPRSDEEREWIGRAAVWVLITALLWTIIAGLVLIVPQAIVEILNYFKITTDAAGAKKIAAALLSAVGGASGILTAIVGGGAEDGRDPRGLTTFRGASFFISARRCS
jgi:hypothetical protein